MPDGFLQSIWSALTSSTAEFTNAAISDQIAALRRLLALPENAVVRLWVESGSSYGHQSSTVNLLYRIARPAGADGLNLGYVGTIEVYYETADDLPKLHALIPELGGQTSGQVGGATVELIQYANAPGTTVTFGLTGGASSTHDYAQTLNVDYFLRLQPYNWSGTEQIEFRSGRKPIDLTTVAEVGAERFKRRLYYVDRSMYEDPPWQALLDAATTAYDRQKLKIVRYLFGDGVLADYQVQAAYSIKSGSLQFNQNTAFGAAVICAGALQWQVDGKPYAKAKPVVIVNFDEFGTAEVSAEDDLRSVLAGKLAADEQGFQFAINAKDRAAEDNFNRRKAYFQGLGADPRLHYLNYPQTLEAVQSAIGDLAGHKDTVLFVQLGRSLPAAFAYALFKSGLPPVFEGQNTANNAVNIGRPYLQIPSTKATEEHRLRIYPSVTLARYSSQQVPQALLMIASQVSHSPKEWPTRPDDAPPRMIGRFYQQYTNERSDRGTIRQYFAQVKAFFASPSQDKLLVALAYLNSLLPTSAVLTRAASNPLDELWDKIHQATTNGGPVDLVPGIIGSGSALTDFILKFLTDFAPSLTMTVDSFEPATKPDQLDAITVEGPTDAFAKLGVQCTVRVVFTAPTNKLTAQLRFTVDQTWSMPGAPWMVFDRPFIELTVRDAELPVAACIGGRYPALTTADGAIVARLEIPVGGDANSWPASMTFEPAARPSIANAYQLATGFNIVSSLPAPFNVAAGLGVASVDVDYDVAGSTVGSIAVLAQTDTQLRLVGDLMLDALTVSALVLNPTRDRTLVLGASAEFRLGTRTDAAVVTISFTYPDIVLTGTLTAGTPTLTDLLVTFVPQLQGIALPSEPTLEAFEFMYSQPTDYLSVSTALAMPGWQFSFPLSAQPLFELTRVAFAVTRDRGVNSGSITAQTTLLPSSTAPIGVDISGEYLPNKDLRLAAKTTTLIDVDALVREYLGPDWYPAGLVLPQLKDVGVTLLWGNDDAGSATAKEFEFTGKTARPWQPIAALGDELWISAELTVGYKQGGNGRSSRLPAPTAPAQLGPTELALTDGGRAYGRLGADVTLWAIHLHVGFDFDPTVKKVCVTWTDVGLTATVEEREVDGNDGKKTEQIATFTLQDQTVGSIVEKFVSWATGTAFGLMAPFNVLNDISLSGLKITYNFTRKKVDFTVDIGPINLGLFTISGITLAYNPDGNDDGKSNNKVQITVNGSFGWGNDDALSWEPDDPASTPAPPGGGNKYFDLRMLALGQHVTVPGLLEETSVAKVIEKLSTLQVPKPPEIPIGGPNQPQFDADSSWFVAFDFGILKLEKPADDKADTGTDDGKALAVPGERLPAIAGADDAPNYFISLAIVFNDPVLYALRLALEGPMAKIFAGLDFQVMYQQVSQNVGRYSAQIALPTIMRKFQVGVASITLPVFAVEVYTNGDFLVDLGFPWNEDFSRSFSIEVQAGPLPVVGAAGFYVGKLSSATTDKVPHDTAPGWFNPVVVFGFGGQLGLGKSIEAGILRAGFSVTVFGIIEGVLARWQPYAITSGEDKNSLQDGYYFSLTGTFGLQGRLYGSVDFAIISAEVDVRVSLYVRITFAAYHPIPITARASVSVTLTVKINLGLFKISIHLSFKAAIEVTFVLDNPMGDPDQAPWAPKRRTTQLPGSARLAARGLAKARALDAAGLFTMGATAVGGAAQAKPFTPVWANLAPGATLRLQGWLAPALTVAGDVAATPADQQICYVVNFFVNGGEPPVYASDDRTLSSARRDDAVVVPATDVAQVALDRARRTLANADPVAFTDTFDDFAIRVLQWVIAAGTTPMTPDAVNGSIVTDEFLASALDYLSGASTPIPIADIERFLQTHTRFLFELNQADETDTDQAAAPASAVFFPAAPAVTLDVPSFGGQEALHYSFGEYNCSSPDYLEKLHAYFDQLKVAVQQEQRASRAGDARPGIEEAGASIAGYIFGDYFAMIAKLTIQAMRDGLRDYKLLLREHTGSTGRQIASAINDAGHLTGDQVYTAAELFAANQKHPLAPNGFDGGGLTIATMTWRAAGGASFTDIAGQPVFAGAVGARPLALANAGVAIIAAGIPITGPTSTHTSQTGDSLATIAAAVGYPNADALLAAEPSLLTNASLLAAQSVLTVPAFRRDIHPGDTLASVSAQYGVTVDALAHANADVADLFLDDSQNLYLDVPHLPQYQVGLLIDEMKRTLACQHLAGMASRYYLHGLRLPTAFDTGGLTPLADGLFVHKDGRYPPDLGLFALTGQTIPLGDIPDPGSQHAADTSFSFTIDAGGQTWLDLGDDGGRTATFTLRSPQDYQRYRQVKAVASGYLDTQTNRVAPIEVSGIKPRRFPLANEVDWQAAVDVTLPHQISQPSAPKPRLWLLPATLIDVAHSGAVLPTVKPLLARSDDTTGTTVDEPVGNYGFGTLVSFTVHRLDAGTTGSTGPVARTYEIIGAPESEITLLERLLDQLTDDPRSVAAVNLLYRPSPTGSQPNGWQSDDPASSLMSITQTNLSTQTRPPTGVRAVAGSTEPQTNLIGTPNEFFRLLWEASITRQGGFFLTYTSGIGGSLTGLPEHAFNDRNEAELAVLALFATGSDAGQLLTNFMNVAVTDEAFDLSDAALVAEAVPTAVSGPREFDDKDTVNSYAAAYYTDAGVLAAGNADIEFAAGLTVTVTGGLYEVPVNPTTAPTQQNPGADLAQIGAHFGTTAAGIRAANAGQLPDTLAPLTAIKLPSVTVASDGQSLSRLAGYYGAPLDELVAANADVAGLYRQRSLAVATGPSTLAPTVGRGVAGMQLDRVAPAVPDDPSADWGQEYLRQAFSLLAYRIANNNGNDYFPVSNWGLPSGPVDPDATPDQDKIAAPRAAAAGDSWSFRFSVPYSAILAAGNPAANPYGGVGGILPFELAWVDLFGNRILSEFDDPSAAVGRIPHRPAQITGYTDRLVGVGQWPAVASAFEIVPGASGGAPNLVIDFDFDASSFQQAARQLTADEPATRQAGKNTIAQAVAAYTLITEQLADPAGVCIEVTTSLTPSATWTLPAKDPATAKLDEPPSLRAWAGAILTFLTELESAPDPAPPSGYRAELSLDTAAANTDQIFKLDTTVTIRRQRNLVAGELASVAGMSAAATPMAPHTGALETPPKGHPSQRSLTDFAKQFTAALASTNGTEFRIATGTDRDQVVGGGAAPIWVVQLGTTDNQPISYTIDDVGQPTVYAPRPISNELVTGAAPIVAYTTGSVLQPDGPQQIQTFGSIDLDQWMSATLGYVDELFSPSYIAAASMLRRNIGAIPEGADRPDALALLIEAKEKLAANLKAVLIPVYADEQASDEALRGIQEEFYQQMLAKLAGFYGTKAGIQFTATVDAAIKVQPGAVKVPRVFGDIALTPMSPQQSAPACDAAPQPTSASVAVTSPKLDLRAADPDPSMPAPSPYLSALVTSTSVEAKSVRVELTYQGQNIEHQIGRLAGIDGYEPSSWLSFVDISDHPATDVTGRTQTGPNQTPLAASLGTIDVPIVLREFPATPTLVSQDEVTELSSLCYQPIAATPAAESVAAPAAGAQCVRTGSYNPLATATRWHYSFTYSLQEHHEQDQVRGSVIFNVAGDRLGATRDAGRDIFDNLAQFTQVYPRVRDDLNEYLLPIDVDTSDPTTLCNAQAALESAAVMIDWLGTSPPKLLRAGIGDALGVAAPIDFTISERGETIGGVVALTVQLTLAEQLPPRVGAPFVQIAGYTCERRFDDGRVSIFAYKCGEDYLPAKEGMKIAARTFVLPDLEILERQDAQTTVYLTRNDNLVPGKTIAKPFVYKTPDVSFEAPLHPTLVSAEPVNLATIFSTGGTSPVTRSLECQLALLYEALLGNAGTPDVTMQASLYYEYQVNPDLQPVRLPIYLMPPTRTRLADEGVGTPLAKVIATQVRGWSTWFTDNDPETLGGSLCLDLIVMSNLTSQPMPIVHLTGLYVPYADLS